MSANSNIVRVGIAGLGRSGWHIHADALAAMPGSYKVVAVVDPSVERSREAVERFGCRSYESYEQFVSDPSIDMIIVATPSHLHVDHVLAALHAGKHVVCEKPMAGSLKEADRLIRAVEAQDKQVAIFHNRRFEPHYQKVSQVIGSGQLGRIVQARMMQHQFTRRWDWQTLREFNGGLINNIGSHLLDLLLQLFPMDRPRCFAHADAALTLGDTEDHCVLLFQQQGSPLLHVEITNVSAFDQDLWMIMGTKGTLRGNANEINWHVADPSSLPERHLERELKSNTRAYVRDDIRWIKHQWKADPGSDLRYYPYEQFYLRMHAAVFHGGPSPVPPGSVRPLIAALEQAREQAEAGLLPLTLQARTTPDAKPAPKSTKPSLTPIR